MSPDLAVPLTGLVTLTLVVASVMLHYEGLRALSRFVTTDVLPPRGRIASLILGQVALHVAEIGLFAVGYASLAGVEGFGGFDRTEAAAAETSALRGLDLVYYSATVYTTLGFGDIVPLGPLRLMTGVEALTGLVLITWSASFTFLEMQRYWGRG